LPPDRGLADKKYSGVKGCKVRLTYAFTANASGTKKLPPIIIGKAKQPRVFQKKTGIQLGFEGYRNNAKAWMTSSIYQDWLRQWDRELDAKKRNILLLQDNFSGHIVPDGLKRIEVVNFEPNLTAHIQPMDQGIILCFKAHYGASFIHRAIDRYDSGITPSKIYDINQLEAMQLAEAAWHEVDTMTIRHCWCKAGILPHADTPTSAQPTVPISSLLNAHDNNNPITNTESQVESVVEELIERGALQKANCMDIDALLNPADERHVIMETMDGEIYQAVLDARQTQEDALINGGHDNIEDDSPVEPFPTYCEMLEAASVINKYVETLNSPLAWKLATDLASLSRQMHLERSQAIESMYITDYFTHK
jgi:DDE superfamily endonuclease